MSNKQIRVRIAPSPTGPLHVGTARCALYNWLFARQNGGEFILRIDDTDKKRSKNKWEKNIKQGLTWLGLKWDKQYYQSKRIKLYKKYLQKMQKQDKAYKKEGVIWFRVEHRVVKFKDIIRGNLSFDMGLIEDFVIAKSEDKPLYNFACVIDEYDMGITHVIRGEDHISNTPKQILMQESLGFNTPQYAHLPLLLGTDKSKLSKRHGATSLNHYKKDYLPQALFNFLALLGWHPKDNQEILTKQELIKKFDLTRVQKGGAVFETDKLDWLNGQYIKKTSSEKLVKLTGVKKDLIELEKQRARKLTDFVENTKFIKKLPNYKKDLLIWENTSSAKILSNLQEIEQLIKNKSREEVEKILLKKESRGEYFWPFRVALSGLAGSPDPFEIFKVLGKKQVLQRIKIAQKKLQK